MSLDVQGVFIEIGSEPGVELTKQLGVTVDEQGFIVVEIPIKARMWREYMPRETRQLDRTKCARFSPRRRKERLRRRACIRNCRWSKNKLLLQGCFSDELKFKVQN